jgi:hypothetical protein
MFDGVIVILGQLGFFGKNSPIASNAVARRNAGAAGSANTHPHRPCVEQQHAARNSDVQSDLIHFN